MKASRLSRLVPLAVLGLVTVSVAVACGGAVEPGSSSSSTGGPAPTATVTPIPTPTGTTTATPTPSPTGTGTSGSPSIGTWSGTASGCENFTVFAADTSAPRYLVINANKTLLGLNGVGTAAKVDLASAQAGALVGIDQYASAPPQPYCTDVAAPQPIGHQLATSGIVTFTVTSSPSAAGTYTITVTLSGITVPSSFGDLETVPDITYTDVLVGWSPG